MQDPDAASASDAKVTGLITTAHFFSHLYILALPPVFPVLERELGVSVTALGLAIALLNVTTSLAQPPIGFLVDRFGPARLLVAGHATFALAILLAGLSASYPALLACMVLAGLGNAVYHPADYTILANRIEPRRLGRAFSVHTFGGYAGFAAAPVVMVGLTGLVGWRPALVLIGLIGLALGLVLLLMRRMLDLPPREHAAVAGGSAAAGNLRLLTSPAILLGLTFFLLLAMTHGGFSGFSVVAFERLHAWSLAAANLPITAYLAASAAGVLLGGWIADRVRRHERVVAGCCVLVATAMLVLTNTSLPLAVVVAIAGAAGLASGMVAPSRDLIVRNLAPPGAAGRVFGFVMTGFNVGGMLAPLLFGLVVDGGHPRLVFWLIALFSLTTALAVLLPAANRTARIAAA